MVLRNIITSTNPSNSPIIIREAYLPVKLSWSEFKKCLEAKGLLRHLGTSSTELDSCLKELGGKSEIELEEESEKDPEVNLNESTGIWNRLYSYICF